jgi:hypothetical protein
MSGARDEIDDLFGALTVDTAKCQEASEAFNAVLARVHMALGMVRASLSESLDGSDAKMRVVITGPLMRWAAQARMAIRGQCDAPAYWKDEALNDDKRSSLRVVFLTRQVSAGVQLHLQAAWQEALELVSGAKALTHGEDDVLGRLGWTKLQLPNDSRVWAPAFFMQGARVQAVFTNVDADVYDDEDRMKQMVMRVACAVNTVNVDALAIHGVLPSLSKPDMLTGLCFGSAAQHKKDLNTARQMVASALRNVVKPRAWNDMVRTGTCATWCKADDASTWSQATFKTDEGLSSKWSEGVCVRMFDGEVWEAGDWTPLVTGLKREGEAEGEEDGSDAKRAAPDHDGEVEE